jgi:hypothetical protein
VKDYKLLVLSSPASGREREFDDWYEVHIAELVRSSEAMVGAQCFSSIDVSMAQRPPHQHLVVAEFRAEDLDGSWERHLRDFRAGVETGAFTAPPDVFDSAPALQWMFEPVGPQLRK